MLFEIIPMKEVARLLMILGSSVAVAVAVHFADDAVYANAVREASAANFQDDWTMIGTIDVASVNR
jgi:hypothetical protein